MPATYEGIGEYVLTSNTASVTFSSIPQTYTDLILHMSVSGNTSGSTYISLRFNGSSATSYQQVYMGTSGSASAVSFQRVSSSTSLGVNEFSGPNSGYPMYLCAEILNYKASTPKQIITSCGVEKTTTGGGCVEFSIGMWQNNNAITSITVLGDVNMETNSVFSLYGIKAA